MVSGADHGLDVPEHLRGDLQDVLAPREVGRETDPAGQLVAVKKTDLYRRLSRPKKRRADMLAIVRVP